MTTTAAEGTYGRIAARSGLAAKFSIDVGAGVVDPDYRGIVCVLLVNRGTNDFEVRTGDRIAQLILERVSLPTLVEVPDLEADPQAAPPQLSLDALPESLPVHPVSAACPAPAETLASFPAPDFDPTTPGPSSTPSLARDVIADASGSFEARDAGFDESSPSSRATEGPSVRFS